MTRRFALRPWLGSLALVLAALFCQSTRADMIEMLSGASVQGEIQSRDDRSITIAREVAGRMISRDYPLDKVHAVTIAGEREVINPLPSKPATPEEPTQESASATYHVERTRAEVEAVIENVGSTPPDWWDQVQLNYPKTLDLSWPQPPPSKQWNNKKNVGQYYWDVIHPNQGKWQEGVKLAHHLMLVNQRDPEVRIRAITKMANLYQTFLGDFARAAFWWRNAKLEPTDPQGVKLAECYWQLGNKSMALEQLNRMRITTFSTVKLLADMGETTRALKLLAGAVNGPSAPLAFLLAGDIYRQLGQYDRARSNYERVLALVPASQKKGKFLRDRRRAQASLAALESCDMLDLTKVPDGTYKSSSLGYEAQVEVEVVVKSGRIESVRVTNHREKQFYSSINATPAAIVRMQGVQGVDAVTGATITSEAIMNATAKALAAAME